MSFDISKLFDPNAITAETSAFNDKLEAELSEAPPMTQFPPEVVRAAKAEGKGALPLQGPLEGSEWVEIPGAAGGPGKVRVTEPEGEAKGVYLHFHGGGWTIGSAEQYDASCQSMARNAGMRVVSAAYRLAPEHPWPAQKLDCLAAARWVLSETDLPIVIGGESAGAHLAAVTSINLRDEGFADRVKGAVLFYGVYDLRGTPSVRNWGDRNMILSTPVMDWFYNFVDPDGLEREHADLSPLLADLKSLPPAFFVIGTEDPLLDDTLFMAGRWQAAGNVATLRIVPGGVHAFDAFSELPVASEVRSEAEAFVSGCL